MNRRLAKTRQAAAMTLIVACFTAGCVPRATQSHDSEGIRVASDIQARYDDDTNTACNDSGSAPSFLCSGVILRSTAYPFNGHVWDPKGASNPKPGGISFSWMRRDAQFNKVAHGYAQGYILMRLLGSGHRAFRDMEVLCAFPIDGATDERTGKGCGAHADYPGNSGPCQAQGIVNAVQWRIHYQSVSDPYERHNHQCGFTVVSGTPHSAAVFQQVLEAMRSIKEESFSEQNELVIQEWNVNEGAVLPIEAFFYIAGHDGPMGAMSYQSDFYTNARRWVPVVRVTLATSPGSRATFQYRPEDQAVP